MCPWVLGRPCLRPAHLPSKRRERGSARYFPPIQEVFKDRKGKKFFKRDTEGRPPKVKVSVNKMGDPIQTGRKYLPGHR